MSRERESRYEVKVEKSASREKEGGEEMRVEKECD